MRDTVHRPRHACADGFHSAPESLAVRRLDNEMGVISLQRIVREAKPGPRTARGEAALELAHDPDCTQRWQIGTQSQRNVRRQSAKRSARRVPYQRLRTGLAPGTESSPTPPRRRREIECKLGRSAVLHLDSGYVYDIDDDAGQA